MPTTERLTPARRRLRRPFVVIALGASAAVLAGASGLAFASDADPAPTATATAVGTAATAAVDDASGDVADASEFEDGDLELELLDRSIHDGVRDEREDPDDRGDFAPIGVLPANEGSGTAASRTYPGVVWALRDSGGGPDRVALFAFKVADGRLVELDPGVDFRVFPVRGASNGDWEALTIDDRGNLYVADIGNNSCRRDGLRVYRVAEPNPYAEGSASVEASFPVDWPSVAGPCTGHNAESVFAFDGSLYVVSKNRNPGVYRLDPDRPGQPLVKVADVEAPGGGFDKTPTDAAVSVDGQRLVLATAAYRMYVYEASRPGLSGDEAVRDLVSRPPRWSQRYREDGGNRQIEGVSFSHSSYDVVLLSEGRTIQHFPAEFYERGDDGEVGRDGG